MKLSWKQFLLVVLGSAAFGVGMAARDEVSGIALRALMAGLGMGILGICFSQAFQITVRR